MLNRRDTAKVVAATVGPLALIGVLYLASSPVPDPPSPIVVKPVPVYHTPAPVAPRVIPA